MFRDLVKGEGTAKKTEKKQPVSSETKQERMMYITEAKRDHLKNNSKLTEK